MLVYRRVFNKQLLHIITIGVGFKWYKVVPQFGIAKLDYNYIVNGLYKLTYNWGGHHLVRIGYSWILYVYIIFICLYHNRIISQKNFQLEIIQ